MAKVDVNPQALLMPVPVVMVTSGKIDGECNIITLAWVGIVCSEPPMVSIGVRPPRHSHKLIKETGEFVINIPGKDLAKSTDFCGVKSGRDVDKFAETGFSKAKGKIVAAPLIAECPINLECVVKHVLNLGTHDHFIAEVVATHIDGDIRTESGLLDMSAAGFFGYAQGRYYAMGEHIGGHGFSKGQPR